MSYPVRAIVTRRLRAPAGRIYDAFLDRALIGQWMFGARVREERIVRLGNEPRVGGAFSYLVERGGSDIDHVGEYLALERPHRLVFTWSTRDSLPEMSRVKVEITPLDGECVLVLTHEMGPDWAAYVDRSAAAWGKMLDALSSLLTPGNS